MCESFLSLSESGMTRRKMGARRAVRPMRNTRDNMPAAVSVVGADEALSFAMANAYYDHTGQMQSLVSLDRLKQTLGDHPHTKVIRMIV